ncbi:Fc receptor-like A [Lates calcarifer]|uniref:Fc receptor-like A n=1 Tax=Lates calcarifer TaxID=8187 RepID=A0AAJ7Q479_LATCA|nr:Fc receptor-like A [Lates calcarifer]
MSHCSDWWRMTGFTCNMMLSWYDTAVYWCESGSGEFSNAVNITASYYTNIVLVSPVHPVAEGDSVTLGCVLRTDDSLSNVTFYKNGKLVQNDDRGELNISAVSKSDEGFYKCEYSGSESSESWMSVKLSRSSFPVPLIIGLVSGIILITLLPLLLLCWYRKSTNTYCNSLLQSQRNNQSSATDQDENQQPVYSSLSHGQLSI